MVVIGKMSLAEVRERKLMEEVMPWSEQYKAYEREAKQQVPWLDKLVFPGGNQQTESVYFRKLITEEPELRKSLRSKSTEIGELYLAA